MHINLPKRQQGMTFISWLMVLGIAGFFAMIVLALAPVYMEHYSIKEVLLSFKNDRELEKMDNAAIRELMKRRLKINSVYEFNVKDNLQIKRDKGRTTLRVLYEVRKPMVGNVDVVVHFDDEVTR